MGVVVRRYIDILIILVITTPLILVLFRQQHPYFFIPFFKCFFPFLFLLVMCNIANVAHKNIQDRSKSRSRACAMTTSPETSTCEVPYESCS